ncbi:hypothetical protein SDC9_110622 [bioreactor metagenome]|uniref:Uncharacterized protein n=1 Tax=bioreactor metagenome TaxID=1076179 RepID=A0A645BE64_9ZZZZ
MCQLLAARQRRAADLRDVRRKRGMEPVRAGVGVFLVGGHIQAPVAHASINQRARMPHQPQARRGSVCFGISHHPAFQGAVGVKPHRPAAMATPR